MLPRLGRTVLLLFPALVLSVDARAQWSANGAPLCTAASDQTATRAISDGAGGALVAWVDYRGGLTTPDIYLQHVTASGMISAGWPASGLVVCNATGAQNQIALASDGAGGAIVAWVDGRTGTASENIYVVRITSAGSLAAGWTANGIAACAATGSQLNPSLVADGAGGVVVTWDDYRVESDVYAVRLNGSGGRVAGWSADGNVVCAEAGSQFNARAATDGAGGAVVAWEDGRSGGSFVYGQRMGGNGARVWTSTGVALCGAAGSRSLPAIVGDGASGALVAWEDYRGATGDLYATRVSSTGTRPAGWNLDGNLLCGAVGDQTDARIVADGAGGAVVAWSDLRSGTRDVYAARVTSAGVLAAGWTGDGSRVCSAVGSQAPAEVVPDGSGGALFAWYDARNGVVTDVYAQHLASTGSVAPGWLPNGLPVCTAAEDQQSVAAVPAGAGGMVVAWSDRRSGTSYDIYAQHVSSGGTVGPVVDVPLGDVRELALEPPRPNPSRGTVRLALELPRACEVEVTVIDVAGRVVWTRDPSTWDAGRHEITWDGRDGTGARTIDGVYFVRVRAGAESRVQRVVRLD